MKAYALFLGGALAATLTGLAYAATPPKSSSQDCFFASKWQGWKAPDDKTLYLEVNLTDVYRVDLSVGSSFLTGPDPHLFNDLHSADSVCSPLDLDLRVSDGLGGPIEPLIAKSLVKLTPEQVAAIPKKFVP